MRNMEDSLKIYTEVAKSWVLKSARAPITSTINDNHLDLSILSRDVNIKSSDYSNVRLLKVQVRVRGIMEGFIENANERNMPGPLRLFIDRLITNGAFLPKSYLLNFEKYRLDFDPFGAIWEQNREKKHMLIGMFFFTRILVSKFFLKPDENSLPVRKNSKTEK